MGGDRSRNHKHPSPGSCCFSLLQRESLIPRMSISSALFFSFFFFGDSTIKIYNKLKQKNIYIGSCFLKAAPILLLPTVVCVCVFSFSFPKKSPLFTLQQSLLYARPPLRQSPAQPCITPLSSHHFQVCLHCFPCFRSQHDKAINRQLKGGNIAQRIAYCVPVCAQSSQG